MLKMSPFFKFFPPPKYLEMPFVGLDISDQSIKFAELVIENGKLELSRYGSASIPLGVIESGRIIDREKLKTILSQFRKEYKLKNVVVSLPEEQAFVVNIEMPNMDEGELRSSIELQLEEYVPLKAEEAVFDFDILQKPKKTNEKYHVSVSILPKKMVDNYLNVLSDVGFLPLAFEIEGHALSRALISNSDRNGVYLIVDIGKMRTGFALVINKVVVFTSTVVHIGGEDMTKSISKNLNISRSEADVLKMKKGLLRSVDNKDVFYSLVPVVSALTDEIRRVEEYWKSHRDEHQKNKLDKVILTGGQSTLSGLDDYLMANLGVVVEVGNPWLNVASFDDFIPEIDYYNAGRFATAIGLALRNMYHG